MDDCESYRIGAFLDLIQLSLKQVTYPANMRSIALVFVIFGALGAASCDRRIYTQDGVTDGDAFYLAPLAMSSDDPVVQSWVTYSLFKSTCQLEIGGENPARANSFDCEFKSRQGLVNAWEEHSIADETINDRYLDDLSDVRAAGFLAEYVDHYFGDSDWQVPDGLRHSEFREWRRANLRRHKPVIRMIGSWNYRETVEISR